LAVSPVVLVRWPDEVDEVERLRDLSTPRLLLVGADEPPPADGDPLQDWIRLPASDADLHARIRGLELRAHAVSDRPEMAGDGRLRYRGDWVAVSPIDERILQALLAAFEDTVTVAELHVAGWPNRDGTPGALRIHILRIRQVLEPLGLELKTVRDRGYVLQPRASQTVANR
jgi:DNA-binding response OmpR family regulator